MGNGAGMICKCIDPCQSICDKNQSFKLSDHEDSLNGINSKKVNHSNTNTNKEKKIKNKSTNNIENSLRNNQNGDDSNVNKKNNLFSSNNNIYIYMNTNSTLQMSKISNNTNNNFKSGLKKYTSGFKKNLNNNNDIQEIQEEIQYKIVKEENNNSIKKNDELKLPDGDKYEGEIKNKKNKW